MSKKEILQDIYLNPRNPGGFSGQLKLKRAACEVRPDISIKDVKNFLKTQESHTLHGVVPKKIFKTSCFGQRTRSFIIFRSC